MRTRQILKKEFLKYKNPLDLWELRVECLTLQFVSEYTFILPIIGLKPH